MEVDKTCGKRELPSSDLESSVLDAESKLTKGLLSGEEKSPRVWRCPERVVRRCCPFLLRMLRLSGYEDALVIRSGTHLAVWICFVASFVMSLFWFVDLFNWRCVPQTWPMPLNDATDCGIDLVGTSIFLRLCRDFLTMIFHFDSSRQELLQMRWRTLQSLSNESHAALQASKHNIEALRKKVVSGMKTQVNSYIEEVFLIIIPSLKTQKGIPEFDVLCQLLWATLDDISALWKQRIDDLSRQSPKVYKELRISNGEPKDVWDAMLQKFLAGSKLPSTLPEEFSPASLADAVFRPVEDLLRIPDGMNVFQQDVLTAARAAAAEAKARRFGFGRPPWESGGCCQCAVPTCITDIICCWRKPIYPKRYRLCFFWWEVRSELQERLTGSILFASFLIGWIFYHRNLENYISQAGFEVPYNLAWHGLKTLVTKIGTIVLLLLYVVCAATALTHMDRLDAVQETMRAIWKLQDVQDAVIVFTSAMSVVSEDARVLGIITESALPRLEVCHHFGVLIAKLDPKRQESDVLKATSELILHLQWCRKLLPTKDARRHQDWEQVVASLQKANNELVQRNFGVTCDLSRASSPGGTFDAVPTDTFQVAKD